MILKTFSETKFKLSHKKVNLLSDSQIIEENVLGMLRSYPCSYASI